MSGLKVINEVIPNLENALGHVCEEIVGKLEDVNDRSVGLILMKGTKFCVNLCEVIEQGESQINVDEESLNDLWDELVVVREYCWEQLNIGHWKQVPTVWRLVHSYVALLQVILLLGREKDEDVRAAIKECDLGLLLGEPLLDNVLARFAFRLHLLAGVSSTANDGETDAGGLNPGMDIVEEEYRKRATKVLPFHYDGRFDIEIAVRPAIENFVEEYFHPQRPVLMLGVMERWPALGKWNVEYIRKRSGDRTVPIEIGSKYTADEWTQKLVTMETFIRDYVENPSKGEKKGYLAQHQLFHQIPELLEDVEIPEYCYVGSSHYVEINAWFGPAGTISPTHFDAKHNVLTQVFGSKIIRLFRPQDWELLYPFGGEILFNTSQIDVEDAELPRKFPAAVSAKYADVLLEPGMALYIPPKWGHYVKSLAPSFSISFWFE